MYFSNYTSIKHLSELRFELILLVDRNWSTWQAFWWNTWIRMYGMFNLEMYRLLRKCPCTAL